MSGNLARALEAAIRKEADGCAAETIQRELPGKNDWAIVLFLIGYPAVAFLIAWLVA